MISLEQILGLKILEIFMRELRYDTNVKIDLKWQIKIIIGWYIYWEKVIRRLDNSNRIEIKWFELDGWVEA